MLYRARVHVHGMESKSCNNLTVSTVSKLHTEVHHSVCGRPVMLVVVHWVREQQDNLHFESDNDSDSDISKLACLRAIRHGPSADTPTNARPLAQYFPTSTCVGRQQACVGVDGLNKEHQLARRDKVMERQPVGWEWTHLAVLLILATMGMMCAVARVLSAKSSKRNERVSKRSSPFVSRIYL